MVLQKKEKKKLYCADFSVNKCSLNRKSIKWKKSSQQTKSDSPFKLQHFHSLLFIDVSIDYTLSTRTPRKRTNKSDFSDNWCFVCPFYILLQDRIQAFLFLLHRAGTRSKRGVKETLQTSTQTVIGCWLRAKMLNCVTTNQKRYTDLSQAASSHS